MSRFNLNTCRPHLSWTGSAGIHLCTLMYWFNKNVDIRTSSFFFLFFFLFVGPLFHPYPAHAAWILAGTGSAVKAAAVCVPSSHAHHEFCKWALQTGIAFCSLCDKQLLWPLIFHITHKFWPQTGCLSDSNSIHLKVKSWRFLHWK